MPQEADGNAAWRPRRLQVRQPPRSKKGAIDRDEDEAQAMSKNVNIQVSIPQRLAVGWLANTHGVH